MSDLVSAKQAEERLRSAYLDAGRSWVALAKTAKEFRDQRYYVQLTDNDGNHFVRFTDYLKDRGYGPSTVKNLITLYEKHLALGDGIAKLTQENAKILLLLPESKRYEPEVLEMAETKTGSDFWKYCKESKNGAWIPEEHKRPWSITIADSLRERAEAAIELAKSLQETESDEIGLEMIIAHFLQCEEIRKLSEA